MDRLGEEIKKLARLIEESSYTVVLTGEGIAKGGGLTGFNNPGNMLPKMIDPDDFSIGSFKNNPAGFYEAGAPYFDILEQIEPNKVHTGLADLEKRGLVKAIITQNIDGLHQKAGAKNVFEIHGTLRTASCVQCDLQFETEALLAGGKEKPPVPLCPECGEPLKPDVVLAGEPPPPDYHQAADEIKKADLMVIIGSGVDTSPADQLPLNQKNLAIINQSPTEYDQQAKVVIRENPVEVIQLLLEEINGRS